MDFETYLQEKKIDAVAFLAQSPQIYNEWRILFEQVSPKSFTAQKLFLINAYRRKYPLLGKNIGAN
ncbi:hypothetical protein [Hugenholtzia roseola]|uniref:hypothetical protein n=1 Tax=Hugenholtzia roseola TaxID=1002 RepID=UPI0004098C61|nr:hypothetical protein [Hugenholtzia roseola]